jgi:hypothetical protein
MAAVLFYAGKAHPDFRLRHPERDGNMAENAGCHVPVWQER